MGMRHHWHRERAGRRGLLHDRGAGQRRGLVGTRRSTVQESEAKSVSLLLDVSWQCHSRNGINEACNPQTGDARACDLVVREGGEDTMSGFKLLLKVREDLVPDWVNTTSTFARGRSAGDVGK